MITEEVERFIRGSVGKIVCVVYKDGETENLFVHKVDDEGFVCDLGRDVTEPPAGEYWVRLTDVNEARSAGDELTRVGG